MSVPSTNRGQLLLVFSLCYLSHGCNTCIISLTTRDLLLTSQLIFCTSITELPVVRNCSFPCNRNYGIHTHIHRYQISNFVNSEEANSIIPQISSAQNASYALHVVSPSWVWLLPGVSNCCTEQ